MSELRALIEFQVRMLGLVDPISILGESCYVASRAKFEELDEQMKLHEQTAKGIYELVKDSDDRGLLMAACALLAKLIELAKPSEYRKAAIQYLNDMEYELCAQRKETFVAVDASVFYDWL